METKIIYSDRKTLCIKIEKDGCVTVYAPKKASAREIESFVQKHIRWIEMSRAEIMQKSERLNALTENDIETLRRRAKEYIPRRTAELAAEMGVKFAGIKITAAKTRFGSCSGKNSLCFSLYLMSCPTAAVDAVIVHELAHILHKDHSERFYAQVEKAMPDYYERKKLLKNGIL